MSTVALIVPAAGLGRRMGQRKSFLELQGKPLLFHTLDRFLPLRDCIVQTLIVLNEADLPAVRAEMEPVLRERYGVTDIVLGGERRQDSVAAGLGRTRADVDLVAVHDGVRPFVPTDVVRACIDAADAVGAAVAATPMKPTVKRVNGDRVVETVPRHDLWCAQTPQIARRELLVDAYAAAARDGVDVTDDVQVVERLGHPVAIVTGSDLNIKITTPADLALARAILDAGLVGSLA